MNHHQTEAISNADAHLSNAVLPTYSELLALLIRSEDVILARSPGASVAPDLRSTLAKAGVERPKLASMSGLRI